MKRSLGHVGQVAQMVEYQPFKLMVIGFESKYGHSHIIGYIPQHCDLEVSLLIHTCTSHSLPIGSD